MPKAPSGMTDQEIDAVLSTLGDTSEDTDADFRAQADFAFAARPSSIPVPHPSVHHSSRRPAPLAPPKSIGPAMASAAMTGRRSAPVARPSTPPPLPLTRRSSAPPPPVSMKAGLVVPSPFPSSLRSGPSTRPSLAPAAGTHSMRFAPPIPSLVSASRDDEHTSYHPAKTGPTSLMSPRHVDAEEEIKQTLASFATEEGRRPIIAPMSVHTSKASSRSLQPGSLRPLGPLPSSAQRPLHSVPPSAMSTGQMDIPPAELSSPRVRVGGRSTSSWAAAFVAVGAFTGVIAGFVFRGEAAMEHAAALVDGPRTTAAMVTPAAQAMMPASTATALPTSALPANIDLVAANAQPQAMFAVAPAGVAPAAVVATTLDSKSVTLDSKSVVKPELLPKLEAKVETKTAEKQAVVEPVKKPVVRSVWHAPVKAAAKEADEPKEVAKSVEKPAAVKTEKKAGSAQSEADRLAAEQLEQSL